uniref:lipopolysaccharide biosynthesis protein n=1 Tax=Altererythrobacter segetis TaxID=1104773 RepID=UPI00140CC677|nr:lipopolysaccharide biosynthesis protein [Altererythrobacter segetis]
MTPPADSSGASVDLGDSVKRAVIWRSGSQIGSQVVAWAATLLVIRILDPADYGLLAMSQVVIVFLNFLNGYGFAGSLIREPELTERKIRQAFGMLLLVNGALALLQIALAPLAAAYYRHPLIAELLRVQALIFLSTPFISIPEVLLMRQMDFRRQALVNLAATLVSAGVALGGALAGWGVWTLVWAPIALFWTRALGLQLVTREWHWPSFRFAGSGAMFRFGLGLLASTFGWTVITQADTLIAARRLSASELGLYAEALFLTTLIASKFVPPLNEVAFPAYARMQEDRAQLAASFLKAVRLIMLVTCPLYLGLSIVAPDFVAVVLGAKWRAMAQLMTILALAMPAQTLYILFTPAVNATGHVRVTARASLLGALVMPPAFLIGLEWGATGLAYAWLLAFPVLPLTIFMQARGKLGITARQLGAAVAPGLLASVAMALAVLALSRALGPAAPWQRLSLEFAFGALCYAGLLLAFSRAALRELTGLVLGRRQATGVAGA